MKSVSQRFGPKKKAEGVEIESANQTSKMGGQIGVAIGTATIAGRSIAGDC